MLPYLKLCHASVHDQQGVAVEHIIVDGGSTDGTVNWLDAVSGNCRWVSEKDNGMYDALNKGFSMAQGAILAHLNSDEQYLPGTLAWVAAFFLENPEIDFLVGDFLVVDPEGGFVCYRKSFKPLWPFIFSNYLYTFTCTLFYRKKVLENCRYDTCYKSIADADFVFQLLKAGYKGHHVRRYLTTFTVTQNNLSLNPLSQTENEKYNKTLPLWFRVSKIGFKYVFQLMRLIHGNFFEKDNLNYHIYRNFNDKERILTTVKKPGWRWNFK